MKVFFVLLFVSRPGLACIGIAPPPPPPCSNLTQSCSSMDCCDGLLCAPIINRCLPALGRKKRSSGYNPCEYLIEIEETAFGECESDGEEGLTWAEVEQCEDKYADYGVPLPTFEDFQECDLDNDGTLLMEEWRTKTNC